MASSKPTSKPTSKNSTKTAHGTKASKPSKLASIKALFGAKKKSGPAKAVAKPMAKHAEKAAPKAHKAEVKGAKHPPSLASASTMPKAAEVKNGQKNNYKNVEKNKEAKKHASAEKSAGAKASKALAAAKASKSGAGGASFKHVEAESVCREVACEGLATSGGYCRLHYIKNWKKIKRKELILKEGKLNQYIEELVAKYPDKYIEAIRQDLAYDKDFAKVIYDLDLDESVDEFDAEAEGSDAIIDSIKRDFDDEGDTGF